MVPYFIGVFDTVAALGAPGPRRILMMGGLISFVAIMVAFASAILSLTPWFAFWPTFAILGTLVAIVQTVSGFKAHFKSISDYSKKGDRRFHFTAWRFRFYDLSLNPRVRYARHALAIDETRSDFRRVPWANAGEWPDRVGEPEWLQQIWFAGNHSDIGGSYAEDESRLSDTALS